MNAYRVQQYCETASFRFCNFLASQLILRSSRVLDYRRRIQKVPSYGPEPPCAMLGRRLLLVWLALYCLVQEPIWAFHNRRNNFGRFRNRGFQLLRFRLRRLRQGRGESFESYSSLLSVCCSRPIQCM